jgi:hypothetical protein
LVDIVQADPEVAGGEDRLDPGFEFPAQDPGGSDAASEAAPEPGNLDVATDPGPDPGGNPCPRLPGPDDRVRRIVVSHPYDASGSKANAFEVLDLSEEGEISTGGATFSMGRAFFSGIAFTPDGEVGILAQEDGSLGVFRVDGTGGVTVVHAALKGSFYAARVVMDPAGDRAWVLDSQWRENGGGIYAVRIGCDGSLTEEGLVAPAKLAQAMAFVPDGSGRVVVPADDILDSSPGLDTHLLQWGSKPEVLGGASMFPDGEAMVASLAVTGDGKYVLAGDNSEFSGIPNRVGVASLKEGKLVPVQVLTPILDPVALVASPFGDSVIAVSGYGNSVRVLVLDAGSAAAPIADAGPPEWVGKKPELPGAAVPILRGKLKGMVILSENLGVRRLRFDGNGKVVDLGRTVTAAGEEYPGIVGAIGVQP